MNFGAFKPWLVPTLVLVHPRGGMLCRYMSKDAHNSWLCQCLHQTFSIGKRAWTQDLFLRQAELGFFHFLEIVRGWLVPSAGQKIQYNLASTFHRRRSCLLKTGFFRQARELKLQRKNPGGDLRLKKKYKTWLVKKWQLFLDIYKWIDVHQLDKHTCENPLDSLDQNACGNINWHDGTTI